MRPGPQLDPSQDPGRRELGTHHKATPLTPPAKVSDAGSAHLKRETCTESGKERQAITPLWNTGGTPFTLSAPTESVELGRQVRVGEQGALAWALGGTDLLGTHLTERPCYHAPPPGQVSPVRLN